MTQNYTTVVGESAATAAARAEIERLTNERDEARAQVAAVASKVRAECADVVEREGHSLHVALRHVAIAAAAQSALEAYGREKVREGLEIAITAMNGVLRRGPNEWAFGTGGYSNPMDAARDAILAEMEKLK